MPDVWSHIVLGKEMQKTAPAKMKELIADHGNLYAFACQGPDFLFYHTYLCPWDQKMTTVGRRIHQDKVSAMLLCGIKKVLSLKKAGKNWQSLAVYMLGAVAHWAADSAVHPLIYSIVPEENPLRKNRHKRAEMTLDMLLLQKYGLIGDDRARNLRLSQGLPEEVCDYYGKCVTALWRDMPYLSPIEIKRSYRHFIQFMEATEQRNSAYRFTQTLAMLSGGILRFDWFWYPEQLASEEVLPLETLLDEVTAKAIARGRRAQEAMWSYWQGEGSLKAVQETLPEISYANRKMP